MLKTTDINKIRPTLKTVKYLDYKGLYLIVDPKSDKHRHGRYYWLCRSMINGVPYKQVLGEYYMYHHDRAKQKVKVSVDEARTRARKFREDAQKGLFNKHKQTKKDLLASEYPAKYAELNDFEPMELNKKGEMVWPQKQMKDIQRDFNKLIKLLGDRMPSEYSKNDIRVDYILYRKKNEITQYNAPPTSGTIRRNLNSYNAVFNYVNEILEIDDKHRFSKTEIPNEGEDKKEKIDYTSKQLKTLRRMVTGSDDIIEQMIALLIETGMRSGEVVGLRSEDLILDCEQPYIKLHKNSLRRLKTKSSTRLIPLTGASLEITKYLDLDKEWLFDHYLNKNKKGKTELDTESANSTINNNIRAIIGKDAPTSHSFRHTLATRLSSVGCPKSLRDEMGGWASSVSDNYGTPDDMMIKGDYLRASLNW
jgi:integrase